MVGGLAHTDIASRLSTGTQVDEEVAMSSTEDTRPGNRHERRALEAGHEPLAVPMTRVPDWLGISRSKAYEEIAAGRLKAVKCGTRTLVPYASGEAWLNNLPAMAA